MQISHEVPLCLLEDNLLWSDYQYCLPQLLDQYPKYKEFFLNYGKNGGFIIMDNGLFEGHKHTTEDLIDKIELIKPDIFVVPDEWDDNEKTYKNAETWVNHKKNGLIPQSTKLMVVIQFHNYREAKELYQDLLKLKIKHIAFNHSSSGYRKLFPHQNKIVSQMMGRILLINKLMEDGILDEDIYHHLLGCSSPEEFKYYKGYDFIKSVDTSSPIISAYEDICFLDKNMYLKSPVKIIDIMEEPYHKFGTWVNTNIDLFKKYIK